MFIFNVTSFKTLVLLSYKLLHVQTGASALQGLLTLPRSIQISLGCIILYNVCPCFFSFLLSRKLLYNYCSIKVLYK